VRCYYGHDVRGRMDGMKKVFLDIGAHLGETLSEIRKEQYGFDRIVCFEPSPR